MTKKQATSVAATASRPETRAYTVGHTPMLLDGERYEPGDTIELTDAQAAGLDVTLQAVTNATDAKQE